MLQARPLVCSWNPTAGFSLDKSLAPGGWGRGKQMTFHLWGLLRATQPVESDPGPTGLRPRGVQKDRAAGCQS